MRNPFGYSDASYTQAVDSGSYTNFTSDSAGYGLAQRTVEDRKTPLLAFANARGCSIADLDMQLAFLFRRAGNKVPRSTICAEECEIGSGGF